MYLCFSFLQIIFGEFFSGLSCVLLVMAKETNESEINKGMGTELPGNFTIRTEHNPSIGEFLPNIEGFSGDDSGININDFIERIEEIGTYANWKSQEKLLVLRLKVKGQAAEYLKDQVHLKKEDFSGVVAALKARFDIKTSMAMYLSRLTSAYQLPNETTRQFFSRIEALSYRCVPSSDENFENYRQQLLLSTLKNGLRPEILRCIAPIAHLGYSKAKTQAIDIEEACPSIRPTQEATPRTEQVFSVVREGSQMSELTALVRDSIRMNKETMDALLGRVQNLENRVEGLFSDIVSGEANRERHTGQRNTSFRSTARCRDCNNFGHQNCGRRRCGHCNGVSHSRETCWILHPELRPVNRGNRNLGIEQTRTSHGDLN